jgi:AhpD family alkylhydroperoxidase
LTQINARLAIEMDSEPINQFLTERFMPHLSPRDRELVALGAAMGSNCVPCIEYHIPKAREAGLSDSEISEAIRLSDTVRQVPARKVLDVALQIVAESLTNEAMFERKA